MKIFLDTADTKQISDLNKLGIVDGVTTNPTIIAREGRDFKEVISEIATIVDGPISAEVISLDAEEMVSEALQIAKWDKNIVIKIPMTKDGLIAVNELRNHNIKTNVTLVFSVSQALLAIKAGATYISPFVGRLEDIGSDGVSLIKELRELIDFYGYDCEIIAASIRSIEHVKQVSSVGAHIATIPPSLFNSLLSHPLTDSGIKQFLEDHNNSQSD